MKLIGGTRNGQLARISIGWTYDVSWRRVQDRRENQWGVLPSQMKTRSLRIWIGRMEPKHYIFRIVGRLRLMRHQRNRRAMYRIIWHFYRRGITQAESCSLAQSISQRPRNNRFMISKAEPKYSAVTLKRTLWSLQAKTSARTSAMRSAWASKDSCAAKACRRTPARPKAPSC